MAPLEMISSSSCMQKRKGQRPGLPANKPDTSLPSLPPALFVYVSLLFCFSIVTTVTLLHSPSHQQVYMPMPESMHKQGHHMCSPLNSSCTLDMKVLSEGHTSLEAVRL